MVARVKWKSCHLLSDTYVEYKSVQKAFLHSIKHFLETKDRCKIRGSMFGENYINQKIWLKIVHFFCLSGLNLACLIYYEVLRTHSIKTFIQLCTKKNLFLSVKCCGVWYVVWGRVWWCMYTRTTVCRNGKNRGNEILLSQWGKGLRKFDESRKRSKSKNAPQEKERGLGVVLVRCYLSKYT